MLDKSLVYKDIVMCLPFEDLEDLKVPVLPDGYSYKMFESGDEIAWAKLEVLVGEFDCFEDASAYFAKTFLTHEELLADRVCFCFNIKWFCSVESCRMSLCRCIPRTFV